MDIRGLLRSLITISRSKMRNLKWRIQYSCNFGINSTFFVQIVQNEYTGIFEVADYESEIADHGFEVDI